MSQYDKEKVFISHSHSDNKVAQEIIEVLINDGRLLKKDIFCTSAEEHNIKIGQRWLERIEDSLGNCEIFIVLCTKDSMGSTSVWYEMGFIKRRLPAVKIVPISIDLELNSLPFVFQEFQCIKYCDFTWKDKLLFIIHSEVSNKKVYDWDIFNSSLEKLELLFNKKIIEPSPSQLNPNGRYRNIFERLIKEGQLIFTTNDEGYITLTKYGLPHNLLLQLLGAGYVMNRCIYYMRFISDPVANPEFEKLLLDPRCKFLGNK